MNIWYKIQVIMNPLIFLHNIKKIRNKNILDLYIDTFNHVSNSTIKKNRPVKYRELTAMSFIEFLIG